MIPNQKHNTADRDTVHYFNGRQLKFINNPKVPNCLRFHSPVKGYFSSLD